MEHPPERAKILHHYVIDALDGRNDLYIQKIVTEISHYPFFQQDKNGILQNWPYAESNPGYSFL